MSNEENRLLKQALTPMIEPSEHLNNQIINEWEQRAMRRTKTKKRNRFSIALVAVLIAVATSITAIAATHLLDSRKMAERLNDHMLADAFADEQAIVVNESIVSGDYRFTLLGIVSGNGISEFAGSAHDVHPDRTYAVVSIEKQDGSEMPSTQDEAYGQTPFFVSPLIKGQKPWQVNIVTMNGAYNEIVENGIMYRLIELDAINKFADRGVYLAISTSSFYDTNAFHYDEKTGEITPNENYDGANALFELPLDASKANPEEAEQYLQQLLTPDDSSTSVQAEQNENTEAKLTDELGRKTMEEWEQHAAEGVVIPESIKEVTYLEDNMIYYGYEGYEVRMTLEGLFDDSELEASRLISVSQSESETLAMKLERDANGIIRGMILKLD